MSYRLNIGNKRAHIEQMLTGIMSGRRPGYEREEATVGNCTDDRYKRKRVGNVGCKICNMDADILLFHRVQMKVELLYLGPIVAPGECNHVGCGPALARIGVTGLASWRPCEWEARPHPHSRNRGYDDTASADM